MKIYAVIELSNATDETDLIQDELEKLMRFPTVKCVISTSNLGDLINHTIRDGIVRPVQDSENWRCVAGVTAVFPSEDDEPVVNATASVEKHYTIYHAIGSNAFHEVEDQERLYAGWLYATSLEDAFRKSQNTDKPWRNTRTRSTSVGDVIQCNNERYMVTGTGFKLLQLPEDTAWKDVDRARQEDLKNEADLNAFEAQNC